MNAKLKQRQVEALRGPMIKHGMPDGTVVEEPVKNFFKRGVLMPYFPLFTTPDLVEPVLKTCEPAHQE